MVPAGVGATRPRSLSAGSIRKLLSLLVKRLFGSSHIAGLRALVFNAVTICSRDCLKRRQGASRKGRCSAEKTSPVVSNSPVTRKLKAISLKVLKLVVPVETPLIGSVTRQPEDAPEERERGRLDGE